MRLVLDNPKLKRNKNYILLWEYGGYDAKKLFTRKVFILKQPSMSHFGDIFPVLWTIGNGSKAIILKFLKASSKFS